MNARHESSDKNLITNSSDAGGKKPVISRRNFLQILGVSIGAILAACQKIFLTPEPTKIQPTATLEPTFTPTSTVVITPTPQVYQSITLNSEYLKTEGVKISSRDPCLAPDPILVAPEQQKNSNQDNLDSIEYTKQAFQLEELDFQQPLHVLKYAIAQGVRLGTIGGITLFQGGDEGSRAFAGLAIFRSILDSGSNGEHIIQDGYPRGLVIRDGTGISIVGRGSDGNIVIAFEENIDRLNGGHLAIPRLRLAVVQTDTFDDISQQLLPSVSTLNNSSHHNKFSDLSGSHRSAYLNVIDNELTMMILGESGVIWVDVYPDNNELGKSFVPIPLVYAPKPDRDVMPESVDFNELYLEVVMNNGYLGDTKSVSVWAKDSTNNQILLVAHYDKGNKEWIWCKPFFQDVFQKYNMSFGTTLQGNSPYSDRYFLNAITTDHNQLLVPTFRTTFEEYPGSEELASGLITEIIVPNRMQYVMHPGIFHGDIPTHIRNVSTDEVITYMKLTVSKYFDFIELARGSNRPPLVQFLTEALFYDNNSHSGRYIDSPFSRAFFDATTGLHHIISSTYLLFFEEARRRGLQPGTDYIPQWSETDVIKPGGHTSYLVQEGCRAKQEISDALGTTVDEIVLDIASQHHILVGQKPSGWEFMRSAPSYDEMVGALQEIRNGLGGSTKVHCDSLHILGTNDPVLIMEKLKEAMKASVDGGAASILMWDSVNAISPILGGNYPFQNQGLYLPNSYAPSPTHDSLVDAFA